jgi:U3 small nucleolar RNA-associated protein 22
MGPFPTKRRKLDHGRTSPDGSKSDSGSLREESALKNSTEPPPPSKSSQTKRTQDDDDSALYAGGLYKSSLFKLQVDELLREVQLKYEKRFNGVNDILHRLKGLIETIEERDYLSVSQVIDSIKQHIY